MSKCRSIVYNLLIFCISVICQRRLKGEVSFRGKFLSHLRDENELRVLPGRRLPAHIRFIIHTIRTRHAFIGPVTNAAQEKADFSTKKPPKEIILHCVHHSPADQIFIDQFHNLLDALRTFPSRWFPSTAEVVFTIQINARRATLLLIFPTASFKLPSANEIHIL